MRSFFTAMTMAKDEIRKKKDLAAGEVYKQVEAFVQSGVYSSYKKIKQMVSIYINRGSDKDAALALGISEVTARVHKRNASIELYKVFGEDFFSLLMEYELNKEEISRRIDLLSASTTKSSELLPIEIYTRIKGEYKPLKRGDYSINECLQEINFLSIYSVQRALSELSQLDLNKLRYILAMLDGRAGTTADRYQLISKELMIGEVGL